MANGQKLPWHKNYHDWWLRDLQEHPLEIEGAWNRICNKMWSDPDCPGTLEWPLYKWARLLGVSVDEALQILTYIQDEGIGDVKPANGDTNGDPNDEAIDSFPYSQAELPGEAKQPNADPDTNPNGFSNGFPNAKPNANLTPIKRFPNANPNALVTVTSRHIARKRKALIANRLRQRRHYDKHKDECQPNAPSEGHSNATEDRGKNKEEEGKKPQQLFPEKGPECDEVLRLFNTLCRPPIRPERGARLTPGRKLHIQARWKSPLFARWPGGPLECFRALFETVAHSDLLNGRVRPKKPGQKPFRADLDWLLTEEHATKTLEGKYTDLPTGSEIEAAAGEEPGEDVDEQIRRNVRQALKRRAELDTKHHATA